MYARLIMFKLEPGSRSTAEKIADQFAPALKSRKGYKDATFILNDETGECGALVLWQSKEDAETAAEALFPKVQEALSGIAKEPPTHPLFEVYVPQS